MRLNVKHIEAVQIKKLSKTAYPVFETSIVGLEAACLMYGAEKVVKMINRMTRIDCMNWNRYLEKEKE